MTVLRISRSETHIPADSALLRQQFVRDHALVFDRAIDPAFLATLTAVADRATFVPQHVSRVGDRSIETPPTAGHLIALALRRSGFLHWIAEVSQIADINDVEGRVVETGRTDDERLNWHDDMNGPGRKLAVTINLSENDYSGGAFELRRKGQSDLLFRYHHDTIGAMLIFRVSPELEHQLTPISGGGPRRVFAGWFMGTP